MRHRDDRHAGRAAAARSSGAAAVQAAEITVYLNQATESGRQANSRPASRRRPGTRSMSASRRGPSLQCRRSMTARAGDVTSLGSSGQSRGFRQERQGGCRQRRRIRARRQRRRREGRRAQVGHQHVRSLQARDARSQVDRATAMRAPARSTPGLFQKMGIYDQIKDKIKIVRGPPGGGLRGQGRGRGRHPADQRDPALCRAPMYLGPLPADLMEYGRFGAAVMTVSKNRDGAQALIKFMADPANARADPQERDGAAGPLIWSVRHVA